jgi:hypothetical protein
MLNERLFRRDPMEPRPLLPYNKTTRQAFATQVRAVIVAAAMALYFCSLLIAQTPLFHTLTELES